MYSEDISTTSGGRKANLPEKDIYCPDSGKQRRSRHGDLKGPKDFSRFKDKLSSTTNKYLKYDKYNTHRKNVCE